MEFAHEVDRLGNSYCIDDSSLPNLVMLPHLGPVKPGDAVYQNTSRLHRESRKPSRYGSTLVSPE